MTNAEFLAALHARVGVPGSAVVDLVKRATGRSADAVERLTLGDENEVYRVTVGGGLVVFVRIHWPGDRGFVNEAWAMEQARLAGVPVPEVFAIDDIDGPDGRREAMVLAEAPGRQLAGILTELTPRQRRHVLENVGRTLAHVHAIEMPGVDRPDVDGRWPDPAAVRRAHVAERIGQRDHLVTAGLTSDEVEAAVALIGASPDTPASRDAVLCHGDAHDSHVFVDDDLEVRGLIDWGLWYAGSPIGELAYVSMRYDAESFAAILDGHGAGSLDDSTFRRAIALSVVNQAVGHIAWSESIGNAHGTMVDVAALRTALAQLS